MKEARLYITGDVEGYPFRWVIDNITDEEIIEAIVQAQDDAYNKALEDVKIHGKCIDLIHPWNRSVKISEESINKLKR